MNLSFFIGLITCVLVSTSLWAETEFVLEIDRVPKAGESLVWSPLFQASWDKMNETLGGKPVKVEPENELISRLNDFQWNEKEVLPKDGYEVLAGDATKEFFEEVAETFKKKFGIIMDEEDIFESPNGLAVYGAMAGDIEFKKSFYQSRKAPLKFKDEKESITEVKFFGTAKNLSGEFGRHVKVINYQNSPRSFLLKIHTRHEDETLVIYRPTKKMSFEQAFSETQEAFKIPFKGAEGSLQDPRLHEKDIIKIPYLSFKETTSFLSQLKGKLYYQGVEIPRVIKKAKQVTHFDLTEKGARLKMKTTLGSEPFGGPLPGSDYISRDFSCDEPFFIFLWKEDAKLPYFAVWIGGSDFMKSFSSKE